MPANASRFRLCTTFLEADEAAELMLRRIASQPRVAQDAQAAFVSALRAAREAMAVALDEAESLES